jgi:hypothetical protein
MKLGTMQDVTKDIGPEDRERIDAIRREMVDAQRGHELASLRKAQGLTQLQVAKAMGAARPASTPAPWLLTSTPSAANSPYWPPWGTSRSASERADR